MKIIIKLISYMIIGTFISVVGSCTFLVLIFIGDMIKRLLHSACVIDIIGIIGTSIIILILLAVVAVILAVLGFISLNGMNIKEKRKW